MPERKQINIRVDDELMEAISGIQRSGTGKVPTMTEVIHEAVTEKWAKIQAAEARKAKK